MAEFFILSQLHTIQSFLTWYWFITVTTCSRTLATAPSCILGDRLSPSRSNEGLIEFSILFGPADMYLLK